MSKKRKFSEGTEGKESMHIDSLSLMEPYFLRKVLLEELGDNGGSSIHKPLAVAVHAVLLESGFVGFDPVSGLQTDRFDFPDEFLSPVSFYYSLPALLSVDRNDSSGSDASDYVVLAFLTLGRFIKVYGSLVIGSGIHKLSLDEYRFAPTLDLVIANSAKNDGSFNSNPEDEVMEFWKIVKDELAFPLLIDLCDKTHLALPPCFVRLPTELKFKVLELLPGADIARMECVCLEMRRLASSNDLWKQKFKQEFIDDDFIFIDYELEAEGMQEWKKLFHSWWVSRNERNRDDDDSLFYSPESRDYELTDLRSPSR
ncbi:hypothetical protein F3Y22_tig00003507pilonHSYRG00209 [Hibiscus syriacus]|uniref:F-box domain-containing protein n=2 Tax=Hibiscus syriacus TaxID=106335 RepID=A0A6A3CPV6_HIBSY|nr:hypothetical protein F3Y22_tig00003507pilonHSYRG00209 [Hibiscus syriacus]